MPGRAVVNGKQEAAATSRNAMKGKAQSVPRRPQPGPAEEEQAAKSEAPTSVQPVEPEDAYLTGTSRSLQRRLLGLNVDGTQGQSKPHPEATAAGLHATGSYAASSKPKTKGARSREARKK